MDNTLDNYEPHGDMLYKVNMEDGTWTRWIDLHHVKTLDMSKAIAIITQQNYRKKVK